MNVISFKLIEKVGGNQTAFEVSPPPPPQPLLKNVLEFLWNACFIFMVFWFDNWITAVAPVLEFVDQQQENGDSLWEQINALSDKSFQ